MKEQMKTAEDRLLEVGGPGYDEGFSRGKAGHHDTSAPRMKRLGSQDLHAMLAVGQKSKPQVVVQR